MRTTTYRARPRRRGRCSLSRGLCCRGDHRIESLLGHGGGIPGWRHCEQAHSGSCEIAFLVRSGCFQQPPLALLCPHRRPWTPSELAGIAGTGSGTIDSSRAAGWKPRAPGRQGAFQHRQLFYLSLPPALRAPLWRCGWGWWPPARSNGPADGPESRASRVVCRMICCGRAGGERLARACMRRSIGSLTACS